MKNKVTKIILVLILLLFLLNIYRIPVKASVGEYLGGGGSSAGTTETVVINMAGQIAGIAAAVGATAAIVILLWLAIKYMIAAPEEKAGIKKSATIYFIGAIILFGASGLLALIRGFIEGLNIGA